MPTAQGIRLGRAFVEIGADLSKLTAALRLAKLKLRDLGTGLQAAGTSLLSAGIAAAAPLALATTATMGLSDQMKAVQAVTGATDAQFEQLNEKAKLLGRTTSYTAADVAAAMLNLARAGFSVDEIDAAIAGMLNLARATGTDLAMATEIAAGTLRAFGLDASQSAHVADVLTATANNSAQTLEDLGEALKYVAPVAAEAGLTLEETAKAIGVLANMQIKGSMAGTSLRQIMMALADPAIRERIAALGVAVTDAQGNLRTDFGNVLAEIGQAIQSLPNAERLAILKELFDQRAAGAASKLANADFPGLVRAIENAAGAAQYTADIMDSGLGGAWRRLTSAIEGVNIAIGETLALGLQPLMDTLGAVATRITEWINANRAAVAVAAAVTAGLLSLGAGLIAAGWACRLAAAGIAGLSALFRLIIAPLSLIPTLIAAALSPTTLLIAGIAGLAAAAVTMTDAWRPAFTFLSESFDWIKGTATETWDAISTALAAGDFAAAADVAIAALNVAWTAGIGKLETLWTQFTQAVTETFAGAMLTISNLWVDTKTKLADEILKMADDDTPFANLLHTVLGVDVDAENLRAIRLEQARIEMLKKRLAEAEAAGDEKTAADIRRSLANSGTDTARNILARDAQDTKDKLSRQYGDMAAQAQENAAKSEAEAAARLAEAEAKWRQAVDKAKTTTGPPPKAVDKAKTTTGPPPKVAPTLPSTNQTEKAITDAAAGTKKQFAAAGTFSALATRSLGYATHFDRIAKATEETAQQTKRIARNTEDANGFT